MGKAYDCLAAGYIEERKYNCAERTLRAISKAYDLGLSEESQKLAAAFGGGMAMEYTCGAISGALMALSCMFVKEYAHESDKIKQLSVALFNNVAQELGDTGCAELKKNYRNEQGNCDKIIYAVTKAVDDIIEREKCE